MLHTNYELDDILNLSLYMFEEKSPAVLAASPTLYIEGFSSTHREYRGWAVLNETGHFWYIEQNTVLFNNAPLSGRPVPSVIL